MIWNIVLFYYSPGNKPAGIPDTKKDILKTPVANGRSRLHWLCCSSTWDKPKKAAFSFRGFKAPMAIIPIRTYIILSHLKIFFAGNDMLQVPSCLCLGVFLTGEGATFISGWNWSSVLGGLQREIGPYICAQCIEGCVWFCWWYLSFLPLAKL